MALWGVDADEPNPLLVAVQAEDDRVAVGDALDGGGGEAGGFRRARAIAPAASPKGAREMIARNERPASS
jgi:hypothetical protein